MSNPPMLDEDHRYRYYDQRIADLEWQCRQTQHENARLVHEWSTAKAETQAYAGEVERLVRLLLEQATATVVDATTAIEVTF